MNLLESLSDLDSNKFDRDIKHARYSVSIEALCKQLQNKEE